MPERSDEELVAFYADPVDEHGNVIGHAEVTILRSPWPMRAVKIPASEIALPDDAPTFKVGGDDA